MIKYTQTRYVEELLEHGNCPVEVQLHVLLCARHPGVCVCLMMVDSHPFSW